MKRMRSLSASQRNRWLLCKWSQVLVSAGVKWLLDTVVTTVARSNSVFTRLISLSSTPSSASRPESSRQRTCGRRSSARARQTSCRWPWVKAAPPSSTEVVNESESPTRARALVCLSSPNSPSKSRFSPRVPRNMTGSCGTIVMALRSCLTPTERTSKPSNRTTPWPRASHSGLGCMSNTRNSTFNKVDFPPPGGPQRPTFMPASNVTETLCKTIGVLVRYRALTSLHSSRPDCGQSSSVCDSCSRASA
mmetsp:Transcript_26538/g.61909  ORF Transcript_26538/g.61909 Transcript_26538/m.61909 type:complete len:249 (-) Transcript_26538:11-757(-)